MAFNCLQLKEYVIRPALASIGLLSDDAINLLAGTCAQESAFGTYLVQGRTFDRKDALGIYQQERTGYDEIWRDLVQGNMALRAKIRLFLGYEGKPPFERLITDHALASIICRLYYLRVKDPIPPSDEPLAMALYWKKFYNSSAGKGTPQQFMENYRRFVTC